MPRQCSVCYSLRKGNIESWIRLGIPYKIIARRLTRLKESVPSENSISRHKRDHLQPEFQPIDKSRQTRLPNKLHVEPYQVREVLEAFTWDDDSYRTLRAYSHSYDVKNQPDWKRTTISFTNEQCKKLDKILRRMRTAYHASTSSLLYAFAMIAKSEGL